MPDVFWIVKGRCITCGYLSKRAHNGRVYEFGRPDRFLGKAFNESFPTGDVLTMPHCFRGTTNFREPAEGVYDMEEAAAATFQRDRGCLKWYPHREGLSPQAHLEEQRAYEFEERREAFEQKMEQERRDFEEKTEGERRNFEVGMVERAERAEERRHTLVLWIAGAAAILALAEVGAAILGAGPGSLIGKLLGLD